MMWFTGKTSRGRYGLAGAAFMILAVGLSACGDESVTEATSAAVGDSEASAILSDMTGDLGLTDDQRSELRAIAQEYTGRMGEPGVTWYVAADVQAVLTSEQITQIAARRQELRERIADRRASAGAGGQGGDGAGVRGRGMRQRRGEGPGVGGGPWADLDLSQDQIDAIQDVLENYRPQMESIRDQVRDGSLTREEAREQVGPIRDSIRTEIEALLTPEQLDAIDDRRMDRENAREEAQATRADALGLTAQQQAQIDALRDAPKTEGTREKMREAHRAALEAILTGEQLEIVSIHEALRGHGMLRRFSGGQGFAEGAGFGPRARGAIGRGFGGGS